MKFGNASQNILVGKGDVKGLKKYTQDELDIMGKWKGKSKPKKGKDTRTEQEKGVLEIAKEQLRNLDASRPTFLVDFLSL